MCFGTLRRKIGNETTKDCLIFPFFFPASSLNSDVDCLAVSKLLKKLENAISGGKADEAAILARDLAFLKIQCLVVLNRKPKEDQHPAPIVYAIVR